jgi:hypothetical protein
MTVLHTLRCTGFAGLPRVAKAAGLPASTVESELIDLAVAGLVTHSSGDFGGWGLTDAGRVEDARQVAAELDETGTRATITKAYNDFLVLNPELLDLCTAWQLRPGPKVLDLLDDFHDRAAPVCADLSGALRRFERYRARLTNALTLARAGETGYVTNELESYHSVWFQLHEDLLATLGIPR